MLLAANTLPRDNVQKLQQVHDAAGSAFFDRLLFPLKSQQVGSKIAHLSLTRSQSARVLVVMLTGQYIED